MNDLPSPVPAWFKVTAIVALIWNLLGLAAVAMYALMTPEQMAALPEGQQELMRAAPGWLIYASGAAVVFGVLGSLGLTLKRRWSMPLLILSLIGVLAERYHMFFASNTFEVMGSGAMVLPLVVVVISIALVWLAHSAGKRGWLQ